VEIAYMVISVCTEWSGRRAIIAQ